ncbi:MAG: SdrD B-like domain-containing protein [Chloroflexota bacterium]
MKRLLLPSALIFLVFFSSACGNPLPTENIGKPSSTAVRPNPSNTPIPIPKATTKPSVGPTLTPQSRLKHLPAGPDLENFEVAINPLTGLRQQDPSLLDLPAVLVSISNMPPTARPQAGLSFAAWVYELFIGEGTTRFMSVFYGDLPRRIPNNPGDCKINTSLFQSGSNWIGNRVWMDENQDGIQDPWETGVGGVCVSLIETKTGVKIGSTSTDSNGYYGFETSGMLANNDYTLFYKIPAAYNLTLQNIGNDDQDSDVNPATAESSFTYQSVTDASWDAGLVLDRPGPAVFSASDIAPQRTYVGPIRSGRLTYNDFVRTYPASCLVYASAGDGIRQQLQGCEIIFGEKPGESPNTALLDVNHLKELAQKSKIANQPVNYSGHLFDLTIPDGGEPALSLWTYFHAFSQAFWQYDPLSGSYLRQTDAGDGLGIFHNDTDRLTGRQLAFENVVIILADYTVFRHGQYDVDLCCGLEGYAFLFRDGQMYKIRWSTNNRDWERQTGLLRPLHLTGPDKQPFALKPGRTWVGIMTINSAVKELSAGNWQALFAMPDDLATPEGQ